MATSDSERSEQLNTPPTTEEFADRILTAALGTMETLNLYLGDRLGWFDALAKAEATPAELAERTGTFRERFLHFVRQAGQPPEESHGWPEMADLG